MVGNAPNYLEGSLGIGTTSLTGYNLRISKNITGNADSLGLSIDGTIQSDVTTTAQIFKTTPNTIAAAFTLADLMHFWAQQGTIGSTSAVTRQYGYYAHSSLTGATNNYGFYGNLATSGSRNWNFYAAGTAPNYLAGDTSIGTTTGGYKLNVNGTIFSSKVVNNAAISNSPADASLLLYAPITTNFYGGIIGWAEGNLAASISSYDDGTGGALGLSISTGNATSISERLRISSTGFVGINKSSPTATLDVSGSVLITGSLGVTGPITGSSFTTTGTITAQTLVVQTVSSSIEFVTGSTKFGSLLTNTHQFTGSVTITGSLAVNGSNVILTNQTSSMSVLSSSFAQSASYARSASYADNLVANGTLAFNGTLADYATVGSSIVGSNNLFTRATGSYTSVFVNYTAAKGASARSGQLVAVWNNGATQFTDNSTLDVGGDTGYVTMSAAIVTNQIQVNAQTNSSGWVIKSMATYM
jgi:hypothetical protein